MVYTQLLKKIWFLQKSLHIPSHERKKKITDVRMKLVKLLGNHWKKKNKDGGRERERERERERRKEEKEINKETKKEIALVHSQKFPFPFQENLTSENSSTIY
jgi:hypothetical protein